MPIVNPPPINILSKQRPTMAVTPSRFLFDVLDGLVALASICPVSWICSDGKLLYWLSCNGSLGHAGVPAGKYEKEAWRMVEPHLLQNMAESGNSVLH